MTSRTLLSKHVTKRDRVLLVNPPVFDTRYSWLRWNQPLDLLMIAGHLRERIGCKVDLFDFMVPDQKGRVAKRGLTAFEKHRAVGKGEFEHTYPMWHFGKPFRDFDRWLASERARAGHTEPTQVWITSLCSHWFESVHQTCNHVRQRLPDAKLALLGNYARLMTEHAVDFCDVDVIADRPAAVAAESVSVEPYRNERPPFLALQLKPQSAIATVRQAVADGIYNFTFFEDDVCSDDGTLLEEIVEGSRGAHRHLRFHVICGLSPESLSPRLARLFGDKIFAQIHFESLIGDDAPEVWHRARRYLDEAGVDVDNGDKTSGFVWIGQPGESIETIVQQSFCVLKSFGGLILKPFSPTPGSEICEVHRDYLDQIPYDQWSPHMFPFAEYNGITRNEYHDLYRMAAFLNEKVRNRSFGLLNGSLGTELLRNSLRREVWNLEGSPLSIID